MSLALRRLKLGQRLLLMRLDQTRSSTPPSLKRTISISSENRIASPDPKFHAEPSAKRPRRARQTSPMRSAGQPSSSKPRGRRGGSGRAGRSSLAQKSPAPRARDHHRTLPEPGDPIHDEAWVTSKYKGVTVKEALVTNPKSTILNWAQNQGKERPDFAHEPVLLHGNPGFRCRVNLQIEPPIVGMGDAPKRGDAEKLAALDAVYQLVKANAFERPKQPKVVAGPDTVSLSNGEVINYDRARQFMDYYCRRYGFGKPDISYSEVKGARKAPSTWEAVMFVGGRRIGIGAAKTKKSAQTQCYIDVTQYLESCDPELWKAFTVASAAGKDLGLAPRVAMDIDDRLEDEIRDIGYDIRKSSLYQNRPASKTPAAAAAAAAAEAPRYKPPVPAQYFIDKSKRLADKRKTYLSDPKMEKMRKARASLPVYTRSEELMDHIRSNEVTVCMAATGSGKTTQIPQLILDEYIDRGEGSKCNIICTQPRRIAAISVAQRVAAERGESVGKGSIGYQVRFEAHLPEDHGSVTFCTIGIFLRRMQSALQEASSSRGMNMDDVTHIVVDEVHERDVDTDLLLVVLKRLLADRKAKGKPLKVILMSATVNATLFQQYFPDNTGKPAGLIEIPGRSFPVDKYFMDDFVSELSRNSAHSAVFRDPAVVKYIRQELPAQAAQILSSGPPVPMADGDQLRDDDIDLPFPLVALTIAHVMKKTDDGHVLVFLPGWEEIQNVNRALSNTAFTQGINFMNSKDYSIHLLHSSIPVAEQQVIFEPPPAGVRRIILSTNIAETSVTIPDVVYVVDVAKIKELRYDPQRHMSSLVSAWVGSSNLNQRAGRAGRHRSGEYFGILSRRRHDQLSPNQMVEMQRTDLTNVVMHVKALDFPNMAVEDVLAATIEPPKAESIVAAMEDLRVVGAIDEHQNLTSLGRVLLQLPIEVGIGRMVLFGSFFRCLDQAVSLAAIMTNRDPFVTPVLVKAQAQAVKDGWTPVEYRSDLLATLQAFNTWSDMQTRGRVGEATRFANDNFLSKPTLQQMLTVKRHLLHSLYQSGVLDISAAGRADVYARGKEVIVPPELNVNGDSLPLLVALIASASQPKFAIRTSPQSYRTQRDKSVMIHPSSVNHRKREVITTTDGAFVDKQIIAYQEKRQNTSAVGATSSSAPMYLMTTTRLDPMTYVLFGAYQINVTDRGLECDEWLPIHGNVYALDDLARLKTMIEACMLRVFEGLLLRRQQHKSRRFAPVEPRDEEESGDEDEPSKAAPTPLSPKEVQELDYLTKDVVSILNRFGEDFLAVQSRANSRPGTPQGSPSLSSIRLPRSGASTPWGQGTHSAFNSRPGTPSGLSRGFRK